MIGRKTGGHIEIAKLMLEKGANNLQEALENSYDPNIKIYLRDQINS